ncbi:hypothetical protein ANCDUO_04808 [Ancylostoma duodenale]|uniref:Uncharacterized protein n=1 Tax=Ancylostoma duodenale TaxID=51022 RepID=A0A0C2GU68_9BILA|nr:hypothetical protein ANCDUO_04808 [Ancylostoma duodenale]
MGQFKRCSNKLEGAFRSDWLSFLPHHFRFSAEPASAPSESREHGELEPGQLVPEGQAHKCPLCPKSFSSAR